LLSGYSDDEIEVTLAHELSHHKHNHFWKLIFYNFCFTLLGFFVISLLLDGAIKSGYIKKAYDISFFPVLAVLYISYNIAVLPMFNIFSRTYETEADGDAVLFTKKADTFATLIKKLTLQNFSDPSPSFISKIFFYDHPPAQERILRAMQLKEKDK
jgi:STE24 endopeptidase